MKTKYKYIHFKEKIGLWRKYGVWDIVNNKNKSFLGLVTWHPPWRCYAFLPGKMCYFPQDCLADIIDFIKQLEKSKCGS